LDHLTSLANRRALEQYLEQLQHQPEVSEEPFAVLMLDLDHFKAINDTWGHEVGDGVLKEVARRWSAQVRSSDMLARVGGEEFTAVLGRTHAKSAVLVAEKIRMATDREPVMITRDGEVISVPITVSIGIATADLLGDTDLKQVYRAADEALYEAKHSGRNCIRHRSV
jgi:diguanylate cyclase (GGDEF)-like protein